MALSLSGCVSLLLGTEDTPPRFTLEPVKYDTSRQLQMDVRLIIADPEAEAAFRSSQIAISSAPLRYEYLTGAEWSDRAPRLFGIFLQRSFENHGGIKSVGDRSTLPLGDYILRTDIRQFNLEQRGGNTNAKISVYVQLFDSSNRAIAGKLMSASKPVEGGLTQTIQGFNLAAQQVGDDVVIWSTGQIIEDQQRPEK
ncbi:MAG: ABC-type transport auxiliary lipoprotein family protein [bacterium]